ncbi:MAG: helix-turn-helix transcriptional regulator [Phycisphaerales bacterium]|nr:helix-turn-helix transcriptional regulator [Phycisphaerales bacterium]
MKVKPRPIRRSGCPISIALEIFGDSWSLLIVRDLMFKGLQAFNEFAASGEGIATNILTDRLAKLEGAGILTKRPDPADARRVHYRLTEKGIDLAPALVEIVLWSARYEDTDAPASTVRTMRSHRKQFLTDVRKRWSVAA